MDRAGEQALGLEPALAPIRIELRHSSSDGQDHRFLEFERSDRHYQPVEERIKHWREFVLPLPEDRKQAARMDCGIPYCQGTNLTTGAPTGCPVNSQIPDWNDLVYRGDWQEAARNLHTTTISRRSPAASARALRSVLHAQHRRQSGDHQDHRMRDRRPRDRAGLDQARAAGGRPARRSRSSAPGPAGMACAQQLARAGHDVHVFEKFAKAGGLLRYGIPDFKMEKGMVATSVSGRWKARRHLPLRRPCRRQPAGGEASRRLRRRRARGRSGEGPRPADPGPRAQRHPFRHGLPAAAEPARERRAAGRRRADPRRRQARRRHRRRRHRLGLHRHLDPPGRALGHQFRDPAAAASARTRCSPGRTGR